MVPVTPAEPGCSVVMIMGGSHRRGRLRDCSQFANFVLSPAVPADRAFQFSPPLPSQFTAPPIAIGRLA
ncbi:MAG TPA: hypothetical protein VMC83_21920 [Streptosporangiaceae bacterium]|nr:hypothetical protein [Streptosporangiaceae bacterium]